jgi:hypothetical protein
MPPLSPPPQCAHLMETRPDDTEAVIKKRLQVGLQIVFRRGLLLAGKGRKSRLLHLPLSRLATNQWIIMPTTTPTTQHPTTANRQPPTANRQPPQVYRDEASPVEAFFRERGLLLDFEITAGIPETLPRLLAALQPHMGGRGEAAAAAAAAGAP